MCISNNSHKFYCGTKVYALVRVKSYIWQPYNNWNMKNRLFFVKTQQWSFFRNFRKRTERKTQTLLQQWDQWHMMLIFPQPPGGVDTWGWGTNRWAWLFCCTMAICIIYLLNMAFKWKPSIWKQAAYAEPHSVLEVQLKYMWYLKGVGILLSLQLGYTKYCCLLCEWDCQSRD